MNKSLLTLIFLSPSAFCSSPVNFCAPFNNLALQLAFAQNNMEAPISLADVQSSLGEGTASESATISVYTWGYENRMLVVKTDGGAITQTLILGNDDDSLMSKKIEQAYQTLKSSTSDLIIPEIQKKLGPGNRVSEKMQKKSWECGNGSISLITDQNNNIIASTITYKSPQGEKAIESQIGSDHPQWDIQNNLFGQTTLGWIRKYGNSTNN